MFAGWGRFVYHRRWLVLALSLLLLGAVAGVGFTFKGTLNNTSHVKFESVRASDLLTAELPKTQGGSNGAIFQVVFASKTLSATDPQYQQAVNDALQPLRDDPHVQ